MTEARLREELRERLLSLSYPAFARCVGNLLRSMGYADVRSLGRRHRRGRSAEGGMDMGASAATGVTTSTIVLQLKQYRRPVSRRFVDELRGACVRAGAEQGLLVTTSGFSRAAMHAASARPPVELLDGEALISQLLAHEIGVRRESLFVWRLDQNYLRSLEAGEPESCRRATEGGTGPHPAAAPKRARRETSKLTAHPPGGPMLYRTHCLLAANSLWLLAPFPTLLGSGDIGFLLLAAVAGALLPDLDAEQSRIASIDVLGARPLATLASAIHGAWGHRGPLHSLMGLGAMAVVCLALSPLWGAPPSLALLLGYGSHLAGDAATRSGIPLFYPSRRRYFLLPRPWRLVTGSMAEEAVLVLLALAALPLLLHYLYLLLTAPL